MTMAFTLYPAIDLKDGACVRLVRGAMETATIFNPDPADQARAFAEAGFSWVHIVDLNGAFAGEARNAGAVAAIRAATNVRLQLGGGIRTLGQIEDWLARGINRVILGTIALKNPPLVREAAKKFPGAVAVGIDARDGMVATHGWAETGTMRAEDLARAYADAGVSAIIYTDIARDGTGEGLNIAATLAMARAAAPVPVIASGGLGHMSDLIAARDSGLISGAICGRALYYCRIDAHEALRLERA